MIQNKKIYIITGGISSGKSTFSNILRDKNFLVVDSDKIVHELYEEKFMIETLVENFKEEILTENRIDRKKLGNIVFYNEDKKRVLEDIVHPKVVERIIELINNSNEKVIFIEIPLYFKIEKYIIERIPNYKLIYIFIDKDIQRNRLMARNNISLSKANILMKNIEDNMIFSKKIDYNIVNDSTVEKLVEKVDDFIKMELLDEDC